MISVLFAFVHSKSRLLLCQMKKFLKKRSPDPVPVASTVQPQSFTAPPASLMEMRPAFSGAQFDEMRRHLDLMAVENSKLKSAMQSLTEQNISLQDQLRDREQDHGEAPSNGQERVPAEDDKTNEIQKLVQLITEQNDQLVKELAMEREHARDAKLIYEAQIQRLTMECERYQLENARLQLDLQTAILENDEWRVRASALTRDQNEKAFDQEIDARSKFEACKTLLDELRTRYKGELARMQDLLEKSQDEKRTLGLRLAQVEAESESVTKRQESLWENCRLLESENQKLSALLESKDERMTKMESMFKELLNVSKEMANARAKGEKAWTESRQELTARLQKLEKKCQSLKEDNEKLRNFKQEAFAKLVEARKLLLVDT